MTYSLYDATVVVAKSCLTSLKTLIAKAEQHPNAADLLNARLIDDMHPLTFQVHYATFQAQALAAELSGRDNYPQPEQDVDTYEKLHKRIDEAIAALETTDKDVVNQREEARTEVTIRDKTMDVPVKDVVGLLHMPNINFYVCMTYAILRKEGVDVGKRDWSRAFVGSYVS